VRSISPAPWLKSAILPGTPMALPLAGYQLAVLALQPGRKVLVLGDMGELGSDAAAMHAQIGLAARAAGVDRLLALGDLTKETVGAFGAGAMHFERIQELLAELENELTSDTTVLVKGSRFMQMERVVQSFMEEH